MNKKEKIALLEHIKKDLEKAIYPPTFEYDINYYIGNDTTQYLLLSWIFKYRRTIYMDRKYYNGWFL